MLSEAAAVWLALGLTAVLAALHLAAPRIRRLPLVPERVAASFAAGTAVAYVFLHLLPELVEGHQALGEALAEQVAMTPLLDLGIFLVALAGFTAFYGMDRLAHMSRRGRDQAPAAVFRLHLALFFVFNVLVTYTMPPRVRTGWGFAVLFTGAIGLHFLLVDRALAEHHPMRFPRVGRWVLAGSLFVGWVGAALLPAVRVLAVALMTAFVGGAVLLNVFTEELPRERGSSFPWFVVGVGVYAGLLVAVTAAA